MCDALPVFDALCKLTLSFMHTCIPSDCHIAKYISRYDALEQKLCCWLQYFRPSNPGGSQEHTSLITDSFLMILLSLSNSSIKGT